MSPEWVVFLVIVLVVLLVAVAGRSAGRGGESTAGHYDPDAIGSYTLDPATMAYRHNLPTLPRTAGSAPTGGGPPHRRRRRLRPPSDQAGG